MHVFDIVKDGPEPGVVRALGATYHSESLPESGLKLNVLVECTGVTPVVLDALRWRAPDAVTCLTGVSGTGGQTEVDIGTINREEVLMDAVVFGSVNAKRRPTTPQPKHLPLRIPTGCAGSSAAGFPLKTTPRVSVTAQTTAEVLDLTRGTDGERSHE